ncbi:hypothetical protein PINS_up024183 [Pythium insidiosum]|nr:hypothetical protein PINS_up024183 [Pythium insidiosum]
MPCLITECSPISELQRFGVALLGLYAYHFLWDSLLIAPFADYLVRHGHMGKDKRDKFRESAWKNAAVGTFFLFGLYIGHDKDWWMNPKGYFCRLAVQRARAAALVLHDLPVVLAAEHRLHAQPHQQALHRQAQGQRRDAAAPLCDHLAHDLLVLVRPHAHRHVRAH